MAMGEYSWCLEGGCWEILSGPGLPLAASALLPTSPHSPPRPYRPYFCLPLRHRKPCVHVWSRWEDHTWRLQSTNCVRKVAERLVRVRRVPTGRGWDVGKTVAFERSSGARLIGRAPGSQHALGAGL